MIHTLFRDALMIMLVVIVACIAFMIRWMADPTHVQKGDINSPGALVVTMDWPTGNDDVDLWLMGPNEKIPVFYRNKGGATWDLLRDDLGNVADPTPINYENAFTRGEPAGEYTVNVLCYRCSGHFPIPVHVEVQEKEADGSLSILSNSTVMLTRPKQEATAIDFKVDEAGNASRAMLNTLFRSLVDLAPTKG